MRKLTVERNNAHNSSGKVNSHLLKKVSSVRLLTVCILHCVAAFLLVAQCGVTADPAEAAPIFIGLDADLSAASAQAGQSIRSGALIAIDEINKAGGVMGRRLQLVERDHRGNPARAKVHMEELAGMEHLVAVLGGLHTPAALEVLPIVHEHGIPFLIPWAAGTPVVENGQDPNYVFRVSVRDADAGPFLVKEAKASGYRRLGLLLENTGWGRSNQQAMTKAAGEHDLPEPVVQWFNWGVQDLSTQLQAFRGAGVDAILMVANAPEGLTIIRAIHAQPEGSRFPVLSHWGITGGDFGNQARDVLPEVELRFLQTFSFARPPVPEKAEALFRLYQASHPEAEDPLDIPAVPGLAHAYDLVHLLARAITLAETTDRARVRDALESIPSHTGVMKTYEPPFTSKRHDALDASSFHLARFNESGQIVPAMEEGSEE